MPEPQIELSNVRKVYYKDRIEVPVLEDLDLFFRYSHDHPFHHVKKVTTQFQVRSDNTNAISAMRKEFLETREALWRKYMHTVMSLRSMLSRKCSMGQAALTQPLRQRQQEPDDPGPGIGAADLAHPVALLADLPA